MEPFLCWTQHQNLKLLFIQRHPKDNIHLHICSCYRQDGRNSWDILNAIFNNNKSYIALFSNRVKLTVLYKRLQKTHISIHLNKQNLKYCSLLLLPSKQYIHRCVCTSPPPVNSHFWSQVSPVLFKLVCILQQKMGQHAPMANEPTKELCRRDTSHLLAYTHLAPQIQCALSGVAPKCHCPVLTSQAAYALVPLLLLLVFRTSWLQDCY